MSVAGIDEVGRGPLAGPVVAAAVVFPAGYSNSEIRDSKKLSRALREYLDERIRDDATDWAIAIVPPGAIDELNIREATKLAMSAAAKLVTAKALLIDGNMEINDHRQQTTVIGGDSLHVEIAAASIIAKVWRDREMTRLNGLYPGYGFDQHAGYGTAAHRAAIAKLGPCPIHRWSFKGVREFVHGDYDAGGQAQRAFHVGTLQKNGSSEPRITRVSRGAVRSPVAAAAGAPHSR